MRRTAGLTWSTVVSLWTWGIEPQEESLLTQGGHIVYSTFSPNHPQEIVVLLSVPDGQSGNPNDERQTCSREDDVSADRREVRVLRAEKVAGIAEEAVERVLWDCCAAPYIRA